MRIAIATLIIATVGHAGIASAAPLVHVAAAPQVAKVVPGLNLPHVNVQKPKLNGFFLMPFKPKPGNGNNQPAGNGNDGTPVTASSGQPY